MYEETLVALTVVLPPLAGLACFAVNNRSFRRAVVVLTALLLVGSSIMIYISGGFSYEPGPSIGPIIEGAIFLLDAVLLVYFLFSGLKYGSFLVMGLTVLQLIPVLYFELVLKGASATPAILVDKLSIIMSLIISIVGSLILVYSLSYMDEHEEHLHLEKSNQNRFFFFMLLILGAMQGLVFSNNLYWLYFFWEVTTLCSYELIRHDRTEVAVKNSITALWMNLVGGVAFVAALFVGFYFSPNSISIETILSNAQSREMLVLLALLAFAAFTKSAQFPFNKWLQGAMVAPTPVSALLHSSTMVNAGIYLILRIAYAMSGTTLSYGVTLVGAFTFLATAYLALNERTSKGILAYSTIGNLGLIIVCAGINTSISYVAALTLLVFHSVSKGLLFLGAGVVENRVHTRMIEDWEGLLRRLPFTSIIMIIGMIAMFLPPFGMLIGKWVAIDAITTSPILSALPVIILVILGSAATSVYYIKWLGHLTVLPQDGVKLTQEKLPILYSLSMLSLLSLSLLMAVEASMVINNLVIPALPSDYILNARYLFTGGLLSVETGFGSFLTYPFWVVAVIIIIIGTYIARNKGGLVKGPYLGGENIEENPSIFHTTADREAKVEVSELFLDHEVSSSQFLSISTIIATILLMIIFLTVIL